MSGWTLFHAVDDAHRMCRMNKDASAGAARLYAAVHELWLFAVAQVTTQA